MSYLGLPPTSAAFVTDTFSGTGSQTDFTMSVAPASTTSMLVVAGGVLQDPANYAIVGMTLRFSTAPPAGTGNISVRYMGIPAASVVNTAYRTVTDMTATAGQTTFTVPGYTVGFIDVFRNGVRLGNADFSATSGVSVVLAVAANANDLITTVSFSVGSVLNAIPNVPRGVTTANMPVGTVLQVVSQTLTSTLSGSASTWMDVISASITPTNTANKIVVLAQVYGGCQTNMFGRVLRDGNIIMAGDAAGSRPRAAIGSFYDYTDGNIASSLHASSVDTPSTTSTTIYKIQVWSSASITYINRGRNDNDNTDTARGISSLTLMEIAA